MLPIHRIKQFLFTNTSSGQIILKNTVWLFGGQTVSRFIRITIVIYAARVLGVESYGAFSYALGIAAFLGIFSDMGINSLITREASRNPDDRDRYLATAFGIKLVLLSVLVAGIIVLFPHLTNIKEAILIMPILIFVFAFDTLRDLGSALSRSLERMEIESGISIFTNFMIVALGFIFLALQPTSSSLAFAYAFGSGLGLLAIWYVLRKHFKNLFANFTQSLIRPIIQTAWPFGLLGLMGAITINTDIIMLGWLKGAEEVGLYAAAQKPIQLLYVIPTLIAISIFPSLTKNIYQNPENAQEILKKYLARILLIAFPITILGILCAPFIIQILFGQAYYPAVPTFQILMMTVLIVFPSILITNAIFAYNQQRAFISAVFITLFGNIILNLLLIPQLSIAGAAISTLVIQIITNGLIWRKLQRINPISFKNLVMAMHNEIYLIKNYLIKR